MASMDNITLHDPENDTRIARSPGRMTKAEQSIKQRMFAQLLLSPDHHYSKSEIMDRVGISEGTYLKWSRDPNLADMAGIEPNRHNLKAKLLAAKMKTDALNELHGIMQNDRNGMARVRAAEVILSYDTNMDVAVDDGTEKKKVQQLLQINQPIFVMGNQDMLQSISAAQRIITGEQDPDISEEGDDFIDADYEYLDSIEPESNF